MRVCLPICLTALAVFGLLFLSFVTPVTAFDEDHSEVINGTTLHFRVRGLDKANPYLLLVHGGPGFSSHMFYAWGKRLEPSLNVVYLDQRGCGESARLSVADVMNPKPDEVKDYTFKTLVQDMEGVRQFLQIDKWYVLGHSYGGMLGLEYVTAHPEHILGYIHMDGLVSVPQMQTALLDNAQAKFEADKTGNAALLGEISRIRALAPDNPMRLLGAFGLALGPAGLYFAKDQATAFPAFYGQIREAVKPYNLPATALLPANEPAAALIATDHYLTRDDTPLLAKVTVPTLILNGKQDGVITPQSAEAAHAAIAWSRLIIYDNCGHFPFLEQPEASAAAILDFTGKPRKSHWVAIIVQEAGPDNGFAPISLPRDLDARKLKGKQVVVGYTVDEQGRPVRMSIRQSSGSPEADAAVLDSLRRTKFHPAAQAGVSYSQDFEQVFTL